MHGRRAQSRLGSIGSDSSAEEFESLVFEAGRTADAPENTNSLMNGRGQAELWGLRREASAGRFRFPGPVRPCLRVGMIDDNSGDTVRALVVLAPGATIAESDQIEHSRGRLAHFKHPTSVELRVSLTLTATGNVQKSKLREPYWEGRDRQVD